jgi:hypothetical protein
MEIKKNKSCWWGKTAASTWPTKMVTLHCTRLYVTTRFPSCDSSKICRTAAGKPRRPRPVIITR